MNGSLSKGFGGILESRRARGELRRSAVRAASVEELTIRALRLGGTSVDLLLRQHKSDVSTNVLEIAGDGTVSITL